MKRNLKSKKINTLITEFLKISKSRKPMTFRDLWRKAVGAKINAATISVKFKDGTLLINTGDNKVKSNISSTKSEILEKIQRLNSNIKQIIIS